LPMSFARTLLAMFSRLLARWLCFRLSDQLIAAGYRAGHRWSQRCLNYGPILGGFSGLRSTNVTHYRSW
jgi:hypothetical protein